jgi:Fe-S-cluster-containing dehydrogenase component
MKNRHLVIDVALCQGCNNCFMACKDEHAGNEWPGYTRPQSRHGERWIEIPCRERGQFPLIDVAYRPVLCTHCDDAPCVSRGGGAIRRRPDGIVLIDPDKAAGRRELVDACPYGMIVWSDESCAPQKCTMCAHLLDEGWAEPRCVQACGPGALSFVSGDDPEFVAGVNAGEIETLHPGSAWGTTVCYKNLRFFDSCFIGGSVAIERKGLLDCAPGATASLWKAHGDPRAEGSAAETPEPLQKVSTDAFGDFKFDGLEPDSGLYEVRVSFDGGAPVLLTATLGRSVNLGTIVVEGGR